MLQIQATFTGYSGQAATLFSAYDLDARVLVIGVEAQYQAARRPGCLVLSNAVDIARDSFFSNDCLLPAIAAFYALRSGVAADGKSGRIVFADRALRANPDQAIEQDGLDASGPRYRIAEGVTCGQVAALATCLHAQRYAGIERTVTMAESFRLLLRGTIVTL